MSVPANEPLCVSMCAACGEAFDCHAKMTAESEAAKCWCFEIQLTEAALKDLQTRYRGCLCRNCLVKVSEAE